MEIIDMPVNKRETLINLEVGKALKVDESEKNSFKNVLTKLNKEFPDRKYSLVSVGNGNYAAGRKK